MYIGKRLRAVLDFILGACLKWKGKIKLFFKSNLVNSDKL